MVISSGGDGVVGFDRTGYASSMRMAGGRDRRKENGGRCCGGMSKLWLRSGDPMLARSSVGIVVVSCELHAGLD